MTPAKFTVIPFQQPNTLQCPACSFTSTDGPSIAFAPNASSDDTGTIDCLKAQCSRCAYGSNLEWLMNTAT